MIRKKLAILLPLLLLLSCSRKEVHEDLFDIYEYYRKAPEFQYNRHSPVTILDSTPPLLLTAGTSWEYYYRSYNWSDTTSEVFEVVLDSLQTNVAFFTIRGEKYIVAIDTYGYKGVITEGSETFDTNYVLDELPIPHVKEIPQTNISSVLMDDGSSTYSLDSTIVSSLYGKIARRPYCLVSYNGSEITPIAKTVNEFFWKASH